MRRATTIAAAALAVAAAGPLGAAGAATGDDARADRGAAWLARNVAGAPAGQQADAVVAMRAAGRSRASLRGRVRALSRVAPAYATTAGGAGKVVMAAVAAGADPRRLGGVDYVGRINARYASGRYGASVFDQALSMLALRSAGRRVPAAAVRATLAARGRGGWSFDLSRGGRDSVDHTAIVIEALRASGVPRRNAALRSAASWMLAQRNRSGGLASAGAGGATDANTTAMAIRALRALGRRPPASALRALRSLQERDGAFRFTRADAGSRLLATPDAVIALAGEVLPPR
jgi:hypothetical protein